MFIFRIWYWHYIVDIWIGVCMWLRVYDYVFAFFTNSHAYYCWFWFCSVFWCDLTLIYDRFWCMYMVQYYVVITIYFKYTIFDCLRRDLCACRYIFCYCGLEIRFQWAGERNVLPICFKFYWIFTFTYQDWKHILIVQTLLRRSQNSRFTYCCLNCCDFTVHYSICALGKMRTQQFKLVRFSLDVG